MKEYKVPVQSLIDHIKTATDVDPWAKEMAEDLLKEQENMIPITAVAEYLAGYAAPPVRSPLAVYVDLVTAWERFLKDLNRR